MKDRGVESYEGESPDGTSLTLLDKVRRRVEGAWERLVRLYTPLVCYWCRRAGLQPSDTEEVGQEVFLAVYRNIAGFRHDREGDTFRGWLRAITRTKICDAIPPPGGKGSGGTDAQKRLLEVPEPGPTDESEGESEAIERNIVYRRAVELIDYSFEPKTRRAFYLLIAGKKAGEVAEELGMSVTAVYVAKSKILARLREEFDGLLEAEPPEQAPNGT